ncbi:chromatin assembly factor 1 subunit p90 [Monosporozyma servazzii]
MTDTSKTKKGILSFFQNVPSQKNRKNITTTDTNDSIILIEEDDENKDENKDENTIRPLTERENLPRESLPKEHLPSERENLPSERENLPRESLPKEKELKKLKREQDQLLKKQKRQEEKLKREKLREEEKLKREQLREEEKRRKDQLREEEKRKKDQLREEEKRKKDQLREETKRLKEEEKIKKENEKRAKQEAKERSQLRIGNFFKKSSNDNNNSNNSNENNNNSNNNAKPTITKSDYEKNFLPFYTKDSIIIANTLTLSKNKINSNRQSIDNELLHNHKDNNSLLDWIKSKRITRGYNIKFKAVTLLQQMTVKEKTDEELQLLLSSIPQKYIKFYENVRPPFIGTYSKELILPVSQPFTTEGTGYNYDYDSDLEWVNEEEDGDGVDIDNLESGEDEEDDDDDDDEGSEGEFDGFLDAEDPNNTNSSKKKIMGPLIPVVHLRNQIDQLEKDDQDYFRNISAQPVIAILPLPLDPSEKIIIQRQTEQSTDSSPTKKMYTGVKRNINDVSISPNDQSTDAKKAKILITETKDLLKLFDEIQGSTFSLGTITEIAQKGLPQYNKLIIKHTIREYAARASPKVDSSRKWEVKDTSFWQELKNRSE